MAVNYFKCIKCGEVIRSMKKDPSHCDSIMERILVAPQVKFEEYSDHVAKEKGKKQLKDQKKMLLERARNHSRDNDLDDLIQQNNDGIAIKNQWMDENGKKRRKIEDL